MAFFKKEKEKKRLPVAIYLCSTFAGETTPHIICVCIFVFGFTVLVYLVLYDVTFGPHVLRNEAGALVIRYQGISIKLKFY